MTTTVAVPVWALLGMVALFVCAQAISAYQTRLLRDLFNLLRTEPADEDPQPNLWRLLVRLAPKAKLNDLADALLDQGFVVDTLETEPIEGATEVQPIPENAATASVGEFVSVNASIDGPTTSEQGI